MIGTGVFPTDVPLDGGTVGYTMNGVHHFAFGIIAFLALLVTVFALKGVFRRDPRWSFAARPTAWLALWLLAGMVLLFTIPEDTTVAGVVQRFVFIPNAVWAVWLAWSLRRIGPKVNKATIRRRSEVGNR